LKIHVVDGDVLVRGVDGESTRTPLERAREGDFRREGGRKVEAREIV